MKKITEINKFPVYILDKKIATKYAKEIAELADQIPLVNYSEKEILAESKGERIFHGKWERSLIVFDGDMPIAVIIGYEREGEDNGQYPENSLYISELAVDKNYQKQGIARALLKKFLEHNKKFLHLDGRMIYSVQTNFADWNNHVRKLYKSFGFRKVATKKYDNRADVILRLYRD